MRPRAGRSLACGVALAATLAFASAHAYGQARRCGIHATGSAPWPTDRIHDVISAQLERSYVSLGTLGPVHLSGGNLDSVLFEANIAPHFTLVDPRVPLTHLRPVKAVDFSPRVVLRLHTSESTPLRTPTFNPSGRFFIESPVGRAHDFITVSLGHHSNGQAAPATVNGAPNYVDGNFTNNYLGLGYSWACVGTGEPAYWFVLPTFIEWQFKQDTSTAAHYGHWRTRLSVMRVGETPLPKKLGLRTFHAVLQLDVGAAWDGEGRRGFNALDVSASYAWLPKRAGDIGVFAGAYWGRDYYNIHYRSSNLTVVRFGLVANGAGYTLP